MQRNWAALAAFIVLGACTQPAGTGNTDANGNDVAATAQAAIPDLKGNWVGTSESIVTGMALHHGAQTGKDPLLDNVQFTFAITGQDGHRFWGNVKSAQGEERLTGVIARDGKTILAQDNDGVIHGTLVDADSIDLIYNHGGSSTVVALNTIKRQK